MNNLIFLLATFTFISTLIGGLVAVKFKRLLPYLFAFAAGSLIAVTFFDILPESISIAEGSGIPIRWIFTALVASYFLYAMIEKFFLTHHHHDDHDDHDHPHIMGPIGAGGLVIHSFLDGAAIGAAFQLNPAIGWIVALAVIFHDFTDGINTVTLMLKNKQDIKNAVKFLIADAIAPVLGVAVTYIFTINEVVLAFILAIFAGEFLYIGAANLLPETHKHTSWKMVLSIGFGIVLIYFLTSLI